MSVVQAHKAVGGDVMVIKLHKGHYFFMFHHSFKEAIQWYNFILLTVIQYNTEHIELL